ncbi:hypothetical protein AB1Y20_002182 [Prymnesium parvum]|uniref:Methyltransferase type 11 domain-containing protein n=1 Tax=Prymnesium parvum TaxID=97485 RepID=A0AB34J8E4_PRYPA
MRRLALLVVIACALCVLLASSLHHRAGQAWIAAHRAVHIGLAARAQLPFPRPPPLHAMPPPDPPQDAASEASLFVEPLTTSDAARGGAIDLRALAPDAEQSSLGGATARGEEARGVAAASRAQRSGSASPPAEVSGEATSRGSGGGALERQGRPASPSAEASGGGVALHKQQKAWLEACVNASTLHDAVPNSEYWRQRRYYLFYKHLLCVVWRYAARASSVLDVGSAVPPFINLLTWITNKTILGPRFAGNVAKGGAEMYSLERIQTKYGVGAIQADFLEWASPDTARPAAAMAADMVLCSEVIEHVDQPQEFVRKLLKTAPVVILSVPYRWKACDHVKCHHKVNSITREMIRGWAGRQPDAYDLVKESSGEQRIICVFRSREGVALAAGEGADFPPRLPAVAISPTVGITNATKWNKRVGGSHKKRVPTSKTKR